jgi:hypothetical protein
MYAPGMDARDAFGFVNVMFFTPVPLAPFFASSAGARTARWWNCSTAAA